MSISTLDNHASVRELDAMHAQQERTLRMERTLAQMFMREVMECSMSADSELETVADWTARANGFIGAIKPATVGQVLAGALDYGEGPSTNEAMALIVSAAKGDNVQEKATELLHRSSRVWARFQVTE